MYGAKEGCLVPFQVSDPSILPSGEESSPQVCEIEQLEFRGNTSERDMSNSHIP